jgi:flagellar hook assembly protein FlgD
VIQLSLEYGIQTPYTSYVEGPSQSLSAAEELMQKDISIKGITLSNYPNPFNPSTSIRFFIPNELASLFVTLHIYDMQGRLVAVLMYKRLAGGEYSLVWDGKTMHNKMAASGRYIAVLKIGKMEIKKVITLMR